MTATAAATRASSLTARLTPRKPDLRPWLPALRYCAGVYLAVRVALFALSAAAWGLTNESQVALGEGAYGKITAGWHNAVTSWVKMDAHWFLLLAKQGYHYGSPVDAFYPAYPVLIRAASYLALGHFMVAALVVSNLALLGALVVLYSLTARELGEATARRAVLYLCLFPTAFFLFDAYAESLFLLAAVGAIALARGRHWAWAGLAGLAGALTRSTGAVLAIALAAEAIHQAVENRRLPADDPARPRRPALTTAGRLAASAVPLAGPAGYLLFWQLRFHDWYEPLRLERADWYRKFYLPWDTLWRGVRMAWRYGLTAGHAWALFDLTLVAVGLALSVWVAIRLRPVYGVYTWGTILLFLSDAQWYRPLVSDPRYVVTLFPVIWALAVLGRRQQADRVIVALSSAGLAITGWLFLTTGQVF